MSEKLIPLYHISPEWNLESIRLRGVDPGRSRGKQLMSWWVNDTAILWALAHISARYSVPVNKLVIFVANVDQRKLVNTRWLGVYQTKFTIQPTSVKSPTQYIE